MLGSGILAIAIWPAFHFVAVQQLDWNPWKLYGFAMYCTPHLLTVDLFDTSTGRPRRMDSRALPEPARSEWRSFLQRRHVLGRLVSPSHAARSVFEARPRLRSLRIDTRVERLGFFATGTVANRRSYRFERPDDS